MEWARQPPIQRVQASRAYRSASRTHRRNLLWLLDAHRNRESLGRDECLAGAFLAVAPAVHLMDTEPGWGCDGRNALAVIWATVTIALFLVWFTENHTLHYHWA